MVLAVLGGFLVGLGSAGFLWFWGFGFVLWVGCSGVLIPSGLGFAGGLI